MLKFSVNKHTLNHIQSIYKNRDKRKGILATKNSMGLLTKFRIKTTGFTNNKSNYLKLKLVLLRCINQFKGESFKSKCLFKYQPESLFKWFGYGS